ncbi:MAG: hypothetical protein Greene041619_875 [Candidatus Peregrinibacteria bacterium Greene0416_19]|nr:MAG: hypothetical protein Greene041619_875 [Candidatus Peregrinibacteria bacterium Greene0416_19]
MVPTGSMRNKMLEYVLSCGFLPPDLTGPEQWRSETKEERYQELYLGIWRNAQNVNALIRVLVQERNEIPKRASARALLRGEPTIGLTNSDLLLANTLEDWRNPVSLCSPETLQAFDLPMSSGRNGGDSRWALVAPQGAFEEEPLYRNEENVRVITENMVLAQYFCTERIGAISEDIAARAQLSEMIDGKEEERLEELCRKGEPTILIGVVESGKSAEKRGLAWREVFRVKAQAVVPQVMMERYPEQVNVIRKMLNLKEAEQLPI